ncbi:MAG TPA: MFS transporter [Chloroflexota bacterium]|nr:MFS transporter [Chloroflexota bacterium]
MDGAVPEDGGYKWKVLAVVGAGVFMVTLDSGIVNVALPVLTREFNAPLVLAQWVVLGYVLCITGLLLPAGRLADVLGRKEVFLAGFILFGFSSALCGLAPTVQWLIAARVVQGIGGALVQANTGALLTQAFPARERGRALGLNSSFVSAGLLSGPLIGGLITGYLGWRWAFYVNVPISLVAAPVGWYLLRAAPSRVSRDQRFDPLGALLFLLTCSCLLLGLNQGETWGWTSPQTLGTLGLAVLSAVAFVYVEKRVSQPMIDLTLFRNRGFTAATLSAFLGFLALSPVVLLMPFYYQLVLDVPVYQSGLLLIAIPATTVFLAPISGLLSDRLGSRLLATGGLLLEAVGLATLIVLPQDGPAALVALRLVLVGIGVALFQSPNSSALFGSVPPSRLGIVGGFQALTRNLGSSLGQAISGVVWSAVVIAASAALGAPDPDGGAIGAPPEAMLVGFSTVFAGSTLLVLIAAGVSLLVRPRRPAAVAAEPPRAEALAAAGD